MLNILARTTLARSRALGDKLSSTGIGPALARLTVGAVFMGTGWGKLHSLPDVTTFFTDLGIPFPAFNARLTAGTEFFGGLLMLLGLGTRVAALPLAFTMVIAILTAKRANIDGVTTLLGFEEWSYLVFFVWLAVAGAGPLSLDALIVRWRGWRAGHRVPSPTAS